MVEASRVTPFHFDNLERLSREQVRLHEGILRFLPEALPPEILGVQLTRLLEKYMRERVQFELTAVREPTFGKYRVSVPDPAILFVFTCAPLNQKAFLQVDFALAHIMVDRMLGGEARYSQDLKPITPIEEGILQFIVLKILDLFAEATKGSKIQFRLDRVLSEPSALKDYGDEEQLLALLSFQVTLGKKAGFVRFALPHPLVEGLLANLAPQERPLYAKDFQRLERMVDIKLPIWIELGHLDIDTRELAKLETGDVVLLDKIFVELGENGVQGPVTLRVQEGVGGGFRGEIRESTEKLIEVEIQEVF